MTLPLSAQLGSHEWLMKSAGSGSGRAGQEQVVVDLQATNLLAGGQQIELVAGDAAPAERGDDLAGRDRLEWRRCRTPCRRWRSVELSE